MTREFVEAVRRAAGGLMVSYAQNREDVLLARVLRDVAPSDGFYVDVGANDPVVDSVSFHFHLLGWGGICVEPGEAVFPRLLEMRGEGGRAVCVNAACSDVDGGEVTFFEHPEATGTSTLSAEVDRGVAVLARGRYARKVRRRTVASILDEFTGLRAGREIALMTVDVEGHEREVLTGAELRRHRPRVLVVEAVAPNSNEPRWERFDEVVVGAGYVFGHFDGVNRWYVREEDAGLLVPRMAWPVNTVDGYTTLEAVTWRVRADEANAALLLTRNHVAHVEGQRDTAGARVEALSEALASAKTESSVLSRDLAALRAEHGELTERELRRKEESEALRDRSEVLGRERERLGEVVDVERETAAGLARALESERVRARGLEVEKSTLEARTAGLTARVAELEAMAATLGSAVEAARAEREALAAALARAESERARAEAELGGERGKTETAVAEVHRLRGLVREADARNERLADELNHYRHLNAQARTELDWILKGTGRRSLVVTLPIARAVHRAATWVGMSGVETEKRAPHQTDGGDKPTR